MKYEVIIGLELHVLTKTNTKMFSEASTNYNAEPNTNVNITDMAFPGTLPLVNKKAVQNAIMLSHALHMTIDRELHFDRKNYFYSDLPKGYQITQERRPLGKDGQLEINGRTIAIERLHMEEDTAKQVHLADGTLIDYNRAGLPLVEIVTKPDLRSSDEAMAFVEAIREIVTFLDVSDGKMEEGSLRCDVNISLREVGSKAFGTKVEIKNLNSISNVGRVIESEIKRQTELLLKGQKVLSETRRFDDDKNTTVAMRLKEEGSDYKYFPEGNIYPITLEEEFINDVINNMLELPVDKRRRYFNDYKLGDHEVNVLLLNKELTFFFDEGAKHTTKHKLLINWVIGEVSEYLNKTETNVKTLALSPQNLAKLVNMIDEGVLSNSQARELFGHIVLTNEDAEAKAKELNLVQVSDTNFILQVINEVIDENIHVIADIKAGRDRALGFLVGQVMKKTKGKVNPALANKLMREEIAKR